MRNGSIAQYLHGAALKAVFVFILSVAAGFSFSGFFHLAEAHADSALSGRVAWVADGDTVLLVGGEKVRYLGIDTPERGQPFYEEAKARNKALVESRAIRLEVCKQTPRDKYGRLLAYVYAGGVDVGAALIREGLARPLAIPPCGLPKAAEFRQAAAEAAAKGVGVWSLNKGRKIAVMVAPGDAIRHVGEVVTVKGAVARVDRTKKGAFIRFDSDGRNAFTAVIFTEGLAALKAAGMDLSGFEKGMTLVVTGKVRLYEGRAEIIVKAPTQLKGD